ncbi:MAG TPA: NBR1-Ig-like domain-containing protein, partial [Leptolinea sp.]
SFAPGAGFIKTWRFKNVGSCAWNTSYQVLFASGDPMGAPSAFNLTGSIPPGTTGDLSVSLTAPSSSGTYQDSFKLRAGDGAVFGVGPTYTDPFYTRIKVVIAPPAPSKTPVPPTAIPAPSKTPKIVISLVPYPPILQINPALLWTPTPAIVLPKIPLQLIPLPKY